MEFDYPQAWLAAVSSPGFPGNTLPAFPRLNSSETRTNPVVSGGFGASVRLFKGLSADVDARYFRFDHSNMTRLGGGVSYRF